MADITLTSSIRSNLLSLQNTAALLDRTSTRLSTGLKVNSALDNPGSFFTARSLSNRANDLTKLQDGIGQAIQTLKTADKGITSITNLVEQAKSIADQAKEALASGTVTTLSSAALTAGATVGMNIASAFGTIATGDVITIQVSNGASTTISGGNTITEVLAAITAIDSGVTATYNSTTYKIDIVADAGTVINFDGSSAGVTFLGATTAGTDVSFGTAGGATVETLETDYNKVLTQLDALINNGDTAYKGINLLKSTDLTVNLSENSSSLVISGVDATTTGLGLNAVTWTAGGNIETAITETEAAISSLRSYSSSFGTDLSILQYRQDYTSELINTLEDGSGQLVNANLEEEAANLLALQTRQALGTQSLSISNQSQQSILSLFR
jgi:flagellin-like hook-associated protein FlgL